MSQRHEPAMSTSWLRLWRRQLRRGWRSVDAVHDLLGTGACATIGAMVLLFTGFVLGSMLTAHGATERIEHYLDHVIAPTHAPAHVPQPTPEFTPGPRVPGPRVPHSPQSDRPRADLA